MGVSAALKNAEKQSTVLHQNEVQPGLHFSLNSIPRRPSPEHKPFDLAALFARLATVATCAAIAIGFYLRSYDYFVPGEGFGYTLGIVGGTSMLVLLFYPIAKRVERMRASLTSVAWLRFHMALGTLGPLLILFHSNFSLGAANSNVALFSMIIVALSGVVGRYIYTRIHQGMTGRKLDMGTLLATASRTMTDIGQDVGGNGALVAKSLADFADDALPRTSRIGPNLINAIAMPWRISFARTRIMAEVRKAVRTSSRVNGWNLREERRQLGLARTHVSEFLSSVSQAAQLTLFERLFSMWHILHVPLFFLLLVSGVIHVFAVHLY